MKEKKQIEISFKLALIISIVIIALIVVIGYGVYVKIQTNMASDYEKISIDDKIYYHWKTGNTWNGEYHQDTYKTAKKNEIQEVVSYEDYFKYIDTINVSADEKISNYYNDQKSNYIILSYSSGFSWCKFSLIDCIEKSKQIIIYGNDSQNGVMASGSGYLIVIPTNMPVGTPIEYIECYSTIEINNLKNHKNEQIIETDDKPIIYLYPTENTKTTVKLGYPELITCMYPKYDYQNGWNILAKPDGNLIDINTNKNLYALYYESKIKDNFKIEEEGFIVEKSNVAEFLGEKLSILGLTEREAEEFIIYWLPKLQANEYNYIRFATLDEINANMPLKIEPNPDTVIRILMTFKGLEEPIKVKEQKLITPERKGFTAVEWGATEIK